MLPNEDCAVRDVEDSFWQSFRWQEHLAVSALLCGILNAWVGALKRANPGVMLLTAIRMSYLDRAVIYLTRLEVLYRYQ